jgi:hypothetical protein
LTSACSCQVLDLFVRTKLSAGILPLRFALAWRSMRAVQSIRKSTVTQYNLCLAPGEKGTAGVGPSRASSSLSSLHRRL